jgi:hypothetical protein
MQDEPTPKKRVRSPSYPSIDLEEALQRTKVIWEKAKKFFVAATTANTYWGYEAYSSNGFSITAALKKFGLIEEEGNGTQRQIKLTEDAIALVFNPPLDSPEYREKLKEVALKPFIHSELWSRYDGDLPDDAVIERYLVLERGFNSIYVKPFIKQFKRTIEFSSLKPCDKTTGVHAALQPYESVQTSAAIVPRGSAQHVSREYTGQDIPRKTLDLVPQVHPQTVDARREFTLPTPAGDISIRGPFPLSKSDWATFLKAVQLFEPWLTKPESDPPTTVSDEEKS